jgi:hypothetical protein
MSRTDDLERQTARIELMAKIIDELRKGGSSAIMDRPDHGKMVLTLSTGMVQEVTQAASDQNMAVDEFLDAALSEWQRCELLGSAPANENHD